MVVVVVDVVRLAVDVIVKRVMVDCTAFMHAKRLRPAGRSALLSVGRLIERCYSGVFLAITQLTSTTSSLSNACRLQCRSTRNYLFLPRLGCKATFNGNDTIESIITTASHAFLIEERERERKGALYICEANGCLWVLSLARIMREREREREKIEGGCSETRDCASKGLYNRLYPSLPQNRRR